MPNDFPYIEHFPGLTDRPFTLLPDPEYLYMSKQHSRALSVLQYGAFSRAPVTLLTGEIGAGKTTVLQGFMRDLDPALCVGLISNVQGGRGELLQWILHAFDQPMPSQASYVELFKTFQDFLIGEYAQGRRVMLMIDEAQNLSREGLEEIRMLTNINSNKDEILQLVLVGQPELRDIINQPDMRQLAQRITASYHLKSMAREDAVHYVQHRLKIAGGTGHEISTAAIDRIFDAAQGVPRLINQICETALVYAWTEEVPQVTEALVGYVFDDGLVFSIQPPPAPEPQEQERQF